MSKSRIDFQDGLSHPSELEGTLESATRHSDLMNVHLAHLCCLVISVHVAKPCVNIRGIGDSRIAL